jgi:hypothetical protein
MLVHPSAGRYRLSFTFGGLLLPETRVLAREFRDVGDWEVVRRRVEEGNLLQKTRTASTRRYLREIRDRLEAAYPWEIDVVARDEDSRDVPTVVFAVFSRYYALVGDFVIQVVRRRMLDGLPTVDNAMVRSFMADQAPAHPEINSLSPASSAKIAEVTMRALREAGIVAGQRGTLPVQPPPLSAELRDRYCFDASPEDLARLLRTDEEIAPCLM